MKSKKASKAKRPSPSQGQTGELMDEELAKVAGGAGAIGSLVDAGSPPENSTIPGLDGNASAAHEIISPRDPASGLPTGKRMHKP